MSGCYAIDMDVITRDLSIGTHGACTVIYDGECRFCVKSKEGFERLARSTQSDPVLFIPYQSLEAEQILGPEYRSGQPEVAYGVGPDGRIHQGLDAILPLVLGLPGGRLAGALLSLPGMKPMAHRLYALVARNRYRWFGAVPLRPL